VEKGKIKKNEKQQVYEVATLTKKDGRIKKKKKNTTIYFKHMTEIKTKKKKKMSLAKKLACFFLFSTVITIYNTKHKIIIKPSKNI
jgi:hypothetical protein